MAGLQRALLDALDGGPFAADIPRLRGLLDAGRTGSILAFHHGDRGPAFLSDLVRSAHARGIYATVREGYLRVALHGWHDEEDVGRLADWLS